MIKIKTTVSWEAYTDIYLYMEMIGRPPVNTSQTALSLAWSWVEQGFFFFFLLDTMIKKLLICYFNWTAAYSSGWQKVVHIPYQASY